MLSKNPYHYEDKYKGIRKAITTRFPYILYYRIESENQILVYAVLHMKRSPRIWKKKNLILTKAARLSFPIPPQ
ncbi:MAG: type II toxin-antitoxin system RelE/ParE family toxin [Bacteroidetes bacterium]|jgi:plasmid stabilization system protein ParE|nr:type II toxin-antitoxin system RelE/ParE family toxin [Bacteroidota bacterium]